MADMHEADMAQWIKGRLTKVSGSQWSDQMDVKNGSRDVSIPMAGDGKSTCGKSIAVSREMWEKAVLQTSPDLSTFLSLRFYGDETLARVSHDLVVLDSHTFVRLLQGARAWEDQQEARRTANDTMGVFLGDYESGALDEALEALDKDLAHPVSSGCDCCR
jgi:hypothetical protein